MHGTRLHAPITPAPPLWAHPLPGPHPLASPSPGFKELSESDGHRAPESKRGKDMEDALLERSFWSSVTINPPFYGADTPQSFFDEKLDYGWNLRHLEVSRGWGGGGWGGVEAVLGPTSAPPSQRPQLVRGRRAGNLPPCR